jgi:hypothetical protein
MVDAHHCWPQRALLWLGEVKAASQTSSAAFRRRLQPYGRRLPLYQGPAAGELYDRWQAECSCCLSKPQDAQIAE